MSVWMTASSHLCVMVSLSRGMFMGLLFYFHNKQANLLYNGCRADWPSFIDRVSGLNKRKGTASWPHLRVRVRAIQ